MIAHLLESAVCLLATLAFYKLVLERQKMHHFNRFYLLGSLVLSLTAPFVSFDVPTLSFLPNPTPYVRPIQQNFPILRTSVATPIQPAGSSPNYWVWLYVLVTSLMVTRFGRNVYQLLRLVRISPTVKRDGATIVLLSADVVPHTFGRYLFVGGAAYGAGTIEPELFTHEMAHIRQRHSLDILLVEVLHCFGWFNPLLIGFKRAIRLNHEFLADEAVLRQHTDVPQYQRLLLSKIAPKPAPALISTLTFQMTKQRLTMMTKRTSRIAGLLATGGSVLLFTSLLVAFGTQTIAQVTPDVSVKPQSKTAKPQNDRVPQLTVAEMEERFGDKMVHLPLTKPGQRVEKKLSDLTEEQKKLVRYMPPFERNIPTETQLADWKNAKKFGVWVDDKRIQNKQLDKYKAQDFDHFFVSKLEKNAINYGKHYFQIDLMTKQGYQAYLKESEESPFLFLDTRRR